MTRHARTAAVIVAIALAAASCAGSRNSLGTSASPCFRALPPAQAAVHEEGKLVGVRRVNTSMLKGRLKDNPKVQAMRNEELCLFAFRGSYPPGTVDGADNTQSGRYAIVAVPSKHPAVVGAFVVDQLPTRFTHFH